ncbi:MAG: hypothetical protein EOO54_05855 [Haliea sp.]|nr:MAG: hypothetical protein EOO54_05855 [Haliea sp.]
MELQSARQIIDTLAQGIHPVTGEMMPDDSPYNAPPVIRALFAVAQALESTPRRRPAGPPNAGKPWAPADDAQLEAVFAGSGDLKEAAQSLGRTRWAVESRLVKLGRLAPRGGVPFNTPPAP